MGGVTIKGLVAGFGSPLGFDLLNELKNQGVQCIRQDIQNESQARVDELRTELDAAELQAIWIVGYLDQIEWLHSGDWAEWGNEPDLFIPQAQQEYLLKMPEAFAAAATQSVRLSPGAVSNLNDRGFMFLQRMASLLPADCPVAIHRYPEWPGPEEAHGPASSRDEEVARLHGLIGYQRPIWVTEVGYHTSSQGKSWPFGHERRWSDADVAKFVDWEFRFWARNGAEVCVLYQLNDGPTDNPINRYGIRTSDGRWKPVAQMFTEVV